MNIPNIYTVESVTSGHPDKICDQISDAILDACLEQDPQSRCAVECFGSHGLLVIGGEVSTKAQVDFEQIAKKEYEQIGYDPNTIKVLNCVSKQSSEISSGISGGGAGDQGIVYGYATNETEELLPKGVVLAHALARGLEDLRTSGELPWLLPDGKTQVTIKDGEIDTIIVSTQHRSGESSKWPSLSRKHLAYNLWQKLVVPHVGEKGYRTLLINPAGPWTIGGFDADTGLTGRKIMVDTYGGIIPHGGGCFSGKDATKVDRSGAYMARFVACELVRKGYAEECLVSVAYAIGKAHPVMVEARGGCGEDLSEIAGQYDFQPEAIIERLGLRKPIFKKTSCYGHFGKTELPWG